MHVIFSCAPNKYQRQRISRKESAAEETRELDGGDIMLPLAVSAAERRGCKYQTHNCINVVYLSYHCSVGNQWNFFEYFFLQKKSTKLPKWYAKQRFPYAWLPHPPPPHPIWWKTMTKMGKIEKGAKNTSFLTPHVMYTHGQGKYIIPTLLFLCNFVWLV